MKITSVMLMIFGLAAASSNSFARGGWAPLPKEQQLATLLVSSNGWTGIIITFDGKVIAETFNVGHELPDTGEDRVVATLSQADLSAVVSEVKNAADGVVGNVAEHWDWGVYHVYSANQQSTLLKRWGGRDLSSFQPGYHYAEANGSRAAESLAGLLDSLYSKYFEGLSPSIRFLNTKVPVDCSESDIGANQCCEAFSDDETQCDTTPGCHWVILAHGYYSGCSASG